MTWKHRWIRNIHILEVWLNLDILDSIFYIYNFKYWNFFLTIYRKFFTKYTCILKFCWTQLRSPKSEHRPQPQPQTQTPPNHKAQQQVSKKLVSGETQRSVTIHRKRFQWMGRWRAAYLLLYHLTSASKSLIPNPPPLTPRPLRLSLPSSPITNFLSLKLFSAIPSRVSVDINEFDSGSPSFDHNNEFFDKEDEETGKIPVKAYFLSTRFASGSPFHELPTVFFFFYVCVVIPHRSISMYVSMQLWLFVFGCWVLQNSIWGCVFYFCLDLVSDEIGVYRYNCTGGKECGRMFIGFFGCKFHFC